MWHNGQTSQFTLSRKSGNARISAYASLLQFELWYRGTFFLKASKISLKQNCIPHTTFPRVLIAISHRTTSAFRILSSCQCQFSYRFWVGQALFIWVLGCPSTFRMGFGNEHLVCCGSHASHVLHECGVVLVRVDSR